jgi:TRAP-type C4-dicarboxylate transport system permease small subunit
VKRILKILAKADRILTAILKCITIAIFLLLTAIVSANILLRFFPITSLHWLDEIVEMSFAALVFYGAAGVWMVKGHFSVGDWFGRLAKNERVRSGYRLLLELITLLFAGVLLYYSWNLVKRSIEVTSVFQIPKKILYSCMPASALIMVSYSIVYVLRAVLGIVKPSLLAASEPDAKSSQ